jgi:hypothetical protein
MQTNYTAKTNKKYGKINKNIAIHVLVSQNKSKQTI